MSIFSVIWDWLEDIFSAIHRAWNQLPANVQAGLLNGSGIMNIINQYTDQDPALTIATIQANFPNEDLTAIYSGLSMVAKSWGLDIPSTLSDLIVVIQTHLKQAEATAWPSLIFSAGGLLAKILAGAETPFEIISTLLQWVYTNLVKPAPITLAVSPTPIPALAPTPMPSQEPIVTTTTTTTDAGS